MDRIAKQVLIANGADVNQLDGSNATALHEAIGAAESHPELVQMLIEAGAALDIANKSGLTPLLLAMNRGHDDIVQLLLKAGASE